MVVLQAVLLEVVAPFGEWTRPQWVLWALFMLPQAGAFTKLGAGFLMGLGLDLMMGTYGHHMVAGTVLGGALPGIAPHPAPRDGYEVTQKPTLRDLDSNGCWRLHSRLTALSPRPDGRGHLARSPDAGGPDARPDQCHLDDLLLSPAPPVGRATRTKNQGLMDTRFKTVVLLVVFFVGASYFG